MNKQTISRKLKLTSAVLLFVTLITSGLGGTPIVSAQTCGTTTTPATTFGQVKQSVSVTTAGTYRVWSRIKAPTTSANSYYFQVDNGCAVNVGDATSIPVNTWTWVSYQNGASTSFIDVTLTAGTHNLTYTGKEADVQLDRVLLLTDTACVPTGTGDNCAVSDSTSPTVSVTAPAGGSTVSGASVNVTANATDASGIAKVEFYLNGTLKSTDTTAPYAWTWNTTQDPNGAQNITAKATDTANNTATSAAVNVTVSNAAATPTPFGGTPAAVPGKIEIENFDEGGEGVAYHDTDTVNTSASTYRTGAVDVMDMPTESNGRIVTAVKQTEYLKYTVNVATAGNYNAIIRAGNTGTGGTARLELNGSALPGGIITIPNTGAYTTFADSAPVAVSLPAGRHILTVAVASPATGTSPDLGRLDYLSLSAASTADTTLPTVSLTAPTAGSSVAAGSTVTMNATAADNVGVTKVDFLVNGVLKAADTTSPYSYAWNTTGVAAGTYSLTAKAYDAAGNTRTSTAVSVTVTSTTTSGNGDANGDGRVNALDLSVLISKDGQNYPQADFNNDGTVGAADLAILLSKWTW